MSPAELSEFPLPPRIVRCRRLLFVVPVIVAACAEGSPVDTADNRPPEVTINAPSDGAAVVEGESVTFTASATDAEDGNLAPSVAWASSIDGQLGTGGQVSRTLSVGEHTITASVRDSEGAQGSTSIAVTVSADEPPVVSITSPGDGTEWEAGSAIQLSGSASDAEDGDLAAAITWTSSRDGALGVGGSLEVTLSEGDHTLTASVTDSRGHDASASVAVTVVAPAAVTWLSLSVGAHHTCGIVTGGHGYCWGPGTGGERGDGTRTSSAPVPGPIGGGHTWNEIDAGEGFTCGVTTDDGIYCWGSNLWGQLGGGSTQLLETLPVPVSGGMSWVAVTAGVSHACGITTDGDAFCWGANGNGQLGDGSTTDANTPVSVVGGHTWRSLTAGKLFTCGVTVDDVAYCWGWDAAGQLGDGGQRSQSVPTPVAGAMSWSALSAGYGSHTCGRTTTAALYCWGQEGSGSLGDGGGGVSEALTPSLVAGGHEWTSVTAGRVHTCGITTSGEAFCWGDKGGKLGGDYPTAQVSPAPVSGGMTWELLSAGWNHTCGITTGGEAWCWGSEAGGALGNGGTTWVQYAPSRVVDPAG